MPYIINENNIPTLAIGFTRGLDLLGNSIAFCRGGWKAAKDKSFPTHAFLFTRDEGRLFATEEQPCGLVEKSLAEYCTDKNRIVAVYHWHGFDDPDRIDAALKKLADIRANGDRNSKYDFKALFSFIPLVGKWFKPDPAKMICSESVATILKGAGATWIKNPVVTPDQLEKIIHESGECKAVLGYYK